MRTAAAARRKAFATGLTVRFETIARLRLAAGDERRQSVNVAVERLRCGLRLILRLRLRALLAIGALVRLLLTRLVAVARLKALVALTVARVIAWRKRLLLHRHEARFGAEVGIAVATVLALFGDVEVVARLLLLRLVLAKLFLSGGDQAKVVLGVLVIIFRGDRVAGTARVTGKLDVFFSDVRSGTPNLDIRSVGFENPRHRILAAPIIVIIVVIVISAAHPLVVLTVSHVLPSTNP